MLNPFLTSKYYKPNTFPPAKHAALFKWYNKQVKNSAIFDFKLEMHSYWHSDVQLLRISMQRFHKMFLTLTENEGHSIGA